MTSLAKKFTSDDTAMEPRIPRYLQLARTIHARFTNEEEKQRAVLQASENLAARKNAIVQNAVNEVVVFCNILSQAPALIALLEEKTADITERLFAKAHCTIAPTPMTVEHQIPRYVVDMNEPDHIRLTDAENAFLHIGFNPVQFILESNGAASQLMKYLLHWSYYVMPDGTFINAATKENAPADPVADILAELRARLGYAFFEEVLLPYIEAQAAMP